MNTCPSSSYSVILNSSATATRPLPLTELRQCHAPSDSVRNVERPLGSTSYKRSSIWTT